MVKPALLLGGLGWLALCALAGTGAVFYGDWVDEKFVRIVLAPAALFLMFLLFADKAKLFLLLILVRVSIDPIIEATRAGALSAGALMNLLVLLIAFLMFVEKPKMVSAVVIPMWLPLVLVMALASMRAPELGKGIRVFLGNMTSVAVFIVPFYLKQCQKNLSFTIRIVLWSSVVPAFYALVDFSQGGMGGVDGNRVSSVFVHANIFAFYLLVVITLAFYMAKSHVLKVSRTQRWILFAYIGVLLVDLMLTKTRSAWAACVLVFLMYGLIFERRYLIYLVIGGMLAMLVPDVRDRLLELDAAKVYWTNNMPSNSYEWRQMLWESGIGYMKWSSLPLGYGLQSFAFYSIDFFPLANGGNWGAHNVYVQWLFEAGILGLLCAAWLYFRLFSILKLGIKGDKLGTVIIVTVVIEYLVVSYSDNMLDYLAFNWYFWFVVGAACSIIVRQQAQEKVPLTVCGQGPRSLIWSSVAREFSDKKSPP